MLQKISIYLGKTWTSLQRCTLMFIPIYHIFTSSSSYQRAENAHKQGFFEQEIVPLEGFVKDPATGVRSLVIISKDDGIRYGTTPESLSKIRPAFPQWGGGKTTGGNASQITDGAAAILLMTRRKAEELSLQIVGKFVTTAVSGSYHFIHSTETSRICPRPGTANHGYWSNLCNPQGT